MRSFGKGPRPFPSGGSLARALAACLLMEGQLEADTAATNSSGHPTPVTHPTSSPVQEPTPASTVERGGFGSAAFSAGELNEAIAAGAFICLIGTVFWWESRPPKPKKRAGS